MHVEQEVAAERAVFDANQGKEPGILKVARLLGRHAPEFRGKHFLLRQCLAMAAPRLPSNCEITTRDGVRLLHCDLNQFSCREMFVHGVWEADLTWMYDRLLSVGDTVVDIGANYGYHALRAALRVGKQGRVYAVEPQPEIFAAFQGNIAANNLSNVQADCLALTETEGVLELHRFPGLDPGNTSMGTLGHRSFETILCPSMSLDQYAASKGLESITLIKLDVEGAEMTVLKGADRVLSSPKAPMLVLEINMETAQSCGYHPRDLLKLLKSKGYSFYRPVWGQVVRNIHRLERCEEGRHGQNLLCVVEDQHREQLKNVGVN
jgi:FkbM family methyltransferase